MLLEFYASKLEANEFEALFDAHRFVCNYNLYTNCVHHYHFKNEFFKKEN